MFRLFSRRCTATILKPSTSTSSPFSTLSLNLTPLRPTVSSFNPLQPNVNSSLSSPTSQLDIQPKISAHPGLSSTQLRSGPRDTFSPSHFVRKRRHGFLSRVRTRKGRMTLLRRRTKKRSTLSH